jgi:hypothetical protein
MVEWLKACLLFEVEADILFRYLNVCNVCVTLGRYVEKFYYGKSSKVLVYKLLCVNVRYFRQFFWGGGEYITADLLGFAKILRHIHKKVVMMSEPVYFVAEKCHFLWAVPIA